MHGVGSPDDGDAAGPDHGVYAQEAEFFAQRGVRTSSTRSVFSPPTSRPRDGPADQGARISIILDSLEAARFVADVPRNGIGLSTPDRDRSEGHRSGWPRRCRARRIARRWRVPACRSRADDARRQLVRLRERRRDRAMAEQERAAIVHAATAGGGHRVPVVSLGSTRRRCSPSTWTGQRAACRRVRVLRSGHVRLEVCRVDDIALSVLTR